VIEGRGIEAQDNERSQKVTVINERMARFYFPNSSAIGRHLFEASGKDRVTYTIVGVVQNAKESEVREPAARRLYMAYLQSVEPVAFVNFQIRTHVPSATIAGTVRKALAEFNRNLPVLAVGSAEEMIDNELAPEQVVAKMSGSFGALALVLAGIGLYGVMSYMTARRTAEIGIRLALGAERSNVIWMVLRETWPLVAIGLTIGVAVSTEMARAFEKSLFGLSAFDPATTMAAIAVISMAALIAAYLPARQASRVDPLVALRYE
jgi:hypothetical protein